MPRKPCVIRRISKEQEYSKWYSTSIHRGKNAAKKAFELFELTGLRGLFMAESPDATAGMNLLVVSSVPPEDFGTFLNVFVLPGFEQVMHQTASHSDAILSKIERSKNAREAAMGRAGDQKLIPIGELMAMNSGDMYTQRESEETYPCSPGSLDDLMRKAAASVSRLHDRDRGGTESQTYGGTHYRLESNQLSYLFPNREVYDAVFPNGKSFKEPLMHTAFSMGLVTDPSMANLKATLGADSDDGSDSSSSGGTSGLVEERTFVEDIETPPTLEAKRVAIQRQKVAAKKTTGAKRSRKPSAPATRKTRNASRT